MTNKVTDDKAKEQDKAKIEIENNKPKVITTTQHEELNNDDKEKMTKLKTDATHINMFSRNLEKQLNDIGFTKDNIVDNIKDNNKDTEKNKALLQVIIENMTRMEQKMKEVQIEN